MTIAALRNALRVVGKSMDGIRVVIVGAGAAGVAIIKMLQAEGVQRIIACDRAGIVVAGRGDLDESKRWLAANTNPDGASGSLKDALVGADVFIGVSGPGLLEPHDLAVMAPEAVVFAMANPDPEVDPSGAREYVAVVATGRSDEPNQINNVLAFPGVFRGALDAGARDITDEMKTAAAHAIADSVGPDELSANYIVPSVFNPDVAPAVADAVRRAAGR